MNIIIERLLQKTMLFETVQYSACEMLITHE